MRVDLDSLELHPVRIPMKHRFRQTEFRDAILIRGPSGWGEFSPFPEYSPDVASRWLEAALELATADLPPKGRSRVPVNVTVPALGAEAAAALVMESGATTAKVKIGDPGDSEQDDHERLIAVRGALGPEGHMRVDVNAAWDLETATKRLASMAHLGIQYAEQPVATIEEMVALRGRTQIPIAADEVVRQSSNPLRALEAGAADLLILKVQPMGGVGRVLELASRATAPVVISSAVETSVGMYGGLLAASLLTDLPYACGLGTVSLLAGDLTHDPLVPVDGYLEVRRPEPDPDLLENWLPEEKVSSKMLKWFWSAAKALS